MAAPSLDRMPLYFKLAAIVEKNKRRDLDQLWRGYMTNAAAAFCSKPYADVLEDYERAGMSEEEKRAETAKAKDTAAEIMRALEKARGGESNE